MSTQTRNRVQKGVSTGGQFAKESKSEDGGVELAPVAAPVAKWEQHQRSVEDAAARAGLGSW